MANSSGAIDRKCLGEVFISHATPDKVFVRTLAQYLRSSGFDIWLDERNLLVGDELGRKISRAVERARAVIVIVSKASVRSGWFRYELNLAMIGMINSQTRVLPVLIDDVDVPAELASLLYADCRAGVHEGFQGITRALDAEVQKWKEIERSVASSNPVSRRAGLWRILAQVFDGTGLQAIGNGDPRHPAIVRTLCLNRQPHHADEYEQDEDDAEEFGCIAVEVFVDAVIGPDVNLDAVWDGWLEDAHRVSLPYSLLVWDGSPPLQEFLGPSRRDGREPWCPPTGFVSRFDYAGREVWLEQPIQRRPNLALLLDVSEAFDESEIVMRVQTARGVIRSSMESGAGSGPTGGLRG